VANVGLYPFRSDWRKSNRCFYVDVNYNQLLGRADLNQEIIQKLKPRMTDNQTNQTMTPQQAGKDAHRNPGNIPFGKLRLMKFYCPSVFIESDDDVLQCSGLFVIAVINAEAQKGEKLEGGNKLHILKIEKDVPMDRHGLLLGTPVVNQPKEFFNQGIFYPWLSHQLSANGFYSAATRLAFFLTQGPFNSESAGFSGVNSQDEDLSNGFKPYQVLKNKKFSSVFSPELAQFIEIAFKMVAQMEKDVTTGVGLDATSMAATNTGRNTKDEVLKSADSGNLTIVEYAVRFNDQVYVPSLFTRIRATQDILTQQVLVKVHEIKEFLAMEEGAELMMPPDEMILEEVLNQNQLFRRLVNTSGLRQKYREFYKRRQKQILENQTIVYELELMEQAVIEKLQYAQSPIDVRQMPPIPQQQVRNEETGEIEMLEMDAVAKKTFVDNWIAQQREARKEAQKEAKMDILDIQKKQLALEDVDDIPELSNVLLFNILVEPIEESDIKISGVLSAILKSLTDREIGQLIQLITVMPEEEVKKLSFSEILNLATKGKAITREQVLKSEEQQAREEDKAKKAADHERAVAMEMAKTPGAQPPQFGAGNRSGA
jgi:hypothetical protein